MAPFLHPAPVVTGFKERADAITTHGDRLYIGTSTGNLHVYSINSPDNDGVAQFSLVEIKKGLTRRAIDQLGYIKDINSLVVLSESSVTLFPLPTFSPATPLVKTKSAFSFAIHSSVQHEHVADDKEQLVSDAPKSQVIPTLVTQLLVGCRRKVVIYSWRDSEAQEVKECALPHSARIISFLNHEMACFAYTPTDFAIFSVPTMSATDITTPLPTAASSTAMGALSGLTGYMTLGLGAKSKLCMTRISESEALIAKDNEGYFVGTDAKVSRTPPLEWPAPLEDLAYINPYIFAVLPPGTVTSESAEPSPSTGQPSTIPASVLQIYSSLSLLPIQTLSFPFDSAPPTSSTASSATIRLMSPLSSGKPSLLFLTTPTDRTAATNEGSTIWQMSMKTWAEQIDELVCDMNYSDALAMLDTIGETALPDWHMRRTKIRALNAILEFNVSKYDSAIDTFMELDLNPAKVVALYPESVASRLAVSRDKWIELYGGTPHALEGASGEGKHPESGTASLDPTARREFHQSIEALVKWLTDRRPKLGAALASVNITPAKTNSRLSETSVEELFALPDAPLSALTPEQLLRCAQIVDTVLYKSYLIIRPGLLGPWCRIPNWCEVSEVEEELRARQLFAELRDLYQGKKMHAQALDLLKHLAENETDLEAKLMPSIHYLQKLGQEYLELIFSSSRWIFQTDADMAFEIFTSEDVELPRKDVADFLESVDPNICARYLEYIIEERHEDGPAFHERLAELYFKLTLQARKRGDEQARSNVYSKLLHFIDADPYYAVDRLYGLISSTDLYEARAILLGKLGRHDQALELYVYKMNDYLKAEEYCKKVYEPESETENVFLTLLRIYLKPTVDTTSDLLVPALELISRHNPRLDAVETLQLLPPLVTAQDVRDFLKEALRSPVFDMAVTQQISKARNDQVAHQLMLLQSRRVKITDRRICPQCHKRVGTSVIAVHAPRGEVTHYQCREAFSARLRQDLKRRTHS